jgi:hypothetical protein
MFPALVRYDECERGMVEHAMRLVVKRTRVGPIYPATHQASVGNLTNPNIPAMGQRLRLKATYDIPTSWTKHERAVLLGLKKYGAIVADNGGFFSISVTPDDRYPANAFSHISTLGITNFEVIQSTGPDEGPRSPGAPRADAGPDITVGISGTATLAGSVQYAGTAPSIRWQLYAGPGTVAFGDANRAITSAAFSKPGVYTLLLSADDGVHGVACDAVVVTVTAGFTARIERVAATNVVISWTGGSPPFVLEATSVLPAAPWRVIVTNYTSAAIVPVADGAQFYRVRGP